jgi:hypothetical protein
MSERCHERTHAVQQTTLARSPHVVNIRKRSVEIPFEGSYLRCVVSRLSAPRFSLPNPAQSSPATLPQYSCDYSVSTSLNNSQLAPLNRIILSCRIGV